MSVLWVVRSPGGLQAPSSFCFFIDEAVLQQPSHRRRIKDLARQLSSSNSNHTSSSSDKRSRDNHISSSGSFCCRDCGSYSHGEHCHGCCWCCLRAPTAARPATTAPALDQHEEQHVPQKPPQQQEIPCLFFAVDGGEAVKTPQSAIHINEMLLLLAQQHQQQGPEADAFNSSNSSGKICCLRRVFCGSDSSETSRLKKRKTAAATEDEGEGVAAGGQGTFTLDRQTVLVAVGGGALTDLVGFAASQLLRGVRCLLIPTTLLAAVDAAVGGKRQDLGHRA